MTLCGVPGARSLYFEDCSGGEFNAVEFSERLVPLWLYIDAYDSGDCSVNNASFCMKT